MLAILHAIETAVTLKRGMGMRLWFVFQSLGQLKTCFGEKAPTILDSIGTQQYVNLTSLETAKEISERCGEETRGIVTGGETTGGGSSSTSGKESSSGKNTSWSRSLNSSEIARKLFKPEEILTLPEDTMLVFHKNLPVIAARLVKYFNAPEFRWGGTGRQRGLGLAAVIAAAIIVVASHFAASAILSFSPASHGPDSYTANQFQHEQRWEQRGREQEAIWREQEAAAWQFQRQMQGY